jgi:hypothetical protein
MDRESIKKVWAAYLEVTEAAKMDKVDKKALKKDFDDREDKDIDNDGDVDSSDEYLHNRRKAIAKAMKKEELEEGGYMGYSGQSASDLSYRRLSKAKELAKKDGKDFSRLPYGHQQHYHNKAAEHIKEEVEQIDEAFNLDIGAKVAMKSNGKTIYGKVVGKEKVMGKPGVEVKWSSGRKGRFSNDQFASLHMDRNADYIISEEVELEEKAVSQAQQMAAGAALAAKRGEIPVSDLEGASKTMYDNLSTKELEKFAGTKHKGLPKKVEEAVDQSKGATPPEKMDDKYSQGAKDFVAQHEVEVAVDGQKAADDTAANIKKSEPNMKRRPADNSAADQMGTVDDVTKKAGFKEAKTFADLMKSLMED